MSATTVLGKGGSLSSMEIKKDLDGRTQMLYVCREALPDLSVQQILGAHIDTQTIQNWVTNSNSLYNKGPVDPPVVRIRSIEQEGCTLIYQKWEGVVKEIHEDSGLFLAHLSDLTSNVPDEQAELPLSDIRPDDFELLGIGAVFYWSIGYEITSSGTVKRASALRFQRLPLFSNESIAQVDLRVKKIIDDINWK